MAQQPNIVLISVDSLRADHLGCYGYPQATSPRLDRLASEGALAERLFCPVLPTQPSHTTLFTGQHPITHGVVAHGGKARLSKSAPFLPEVFHQNGYATCSVDTLVRERLWFGRGYEYIIDPSIRHVFYASVTADELNERAIRWMQTVPDGPFFLFMHYWDVHYPYVPPKRYNHLFYEGEGNPIDPDNHELDPWWTHPIGAMARDTWLRTREGRITDPRYVAALYDREIRYLDDGIARLLESLDELGLAENTIFLLLADHGESMTEHGIFFDHYGLYDSTLRVPLIARWPARIPPGIQMPGMLQISDIAPTLLEAADLEVPADMDGRSFLPMLLGEPQSGHDRIFSAESTWQAKWSLRTADAKFILSRQPDLLGNPLRELYDLTTDPAEERNLADDRTDLATHMEAELEGWIADRLKALGRTEDPVRTEGPSMLSTWKGHRP